MHLRQLIESPDTAVFAFGRMNPPTIGHKKLADTVKGIDGTPFLFLTHSQKPKTDPLSFAEKVFFAQQSFGDGIRIGDKDVRTIIQAMQKLESIGFKNVIYVAGSDRVNSFTKLLNDYNGKDYKFDSIKVVSAGERDPDAEGAEGMSASKMRSAAQEGNFDEFESGVAVQNPKLAKMMYTKVRQGMGMAESQELEEAFMFAPLLIPALSIGGRFAWRFGGKSLKWIGKWMKRNPKSSIGIGSLPITGPIIAFFMKALAWLSRYSIPIAVGIVALYGGKKLYDALKDKDPDKVSKEELEEILKNYKPQDEEDLKPLIKKKKLTQETIDYELAELIRRKELKVQQQKPKIDVLNNIAMRSDGKPFPLSWNAGKGEIAVGGKVYVAPKAAKQFISFFDRNEDKQEAMLKALQSASTTAKLFDVLGLKYKLDMER